MSQIMKKPTLCHGLCISIDPDQLKYAKQANLVKQVSPPMDFLLEESFPILLSS